MKLWKMSPLILLVALGACSRDKNSAVAQASKDNDTPPAPAVASAPSTTPDIPPAFDSSRAMQYVKEIVAFGPRPIGSEKHKKVEKYILSHLKGDTVE